MARTQQKLIHLHGTTQVAEGTNGIGLLTGEIAVRNASKGEAELYVTDASGANIVAFVDKTGVSAMVADSAATLTENYGKAIAAAVEVETNRAQGVEAGLQAAIDALNGTGENSVDNKIAAAVAVVQGEVDNLEGTVSTLTQTVADNKAAIEKTVADNKAAIEKTVADNKAAIEGTVSTLTQTVADNKAAIEGTVSTLTQTVTDNKAAYDTKVKALDDKDAELQGAINTEAQARKDADEDLQEAIDAINHEETGILAQAKEYADGKASTAETNAKGYAKEYTDALKTDVITPHINDTNVHVSKTLQDKWNETSAQLTAFLKDADMSTSAVDTLIEIQEFLTGDEGGVASLLESVNKIAKDIEDEIEARTEADSELKTELKTELQGYADQAEADALSAAKTYAEGQAATAKLEAITAAAGDAKSKADAALAEAKTYADQAEADALSAAKTYADTRLGDIAAGTTVKAYVDAAQAAAVETAAGDATTKANKAKEDAISAAAADATTKANNAKSEAISAAAADATTKANNAKSEAISAAAADATTKANNAEAKAKEYVDELGGGYTGNGTYVTVQVTSEGGKVKDVTVTENFANFVIDCGTYDK